MADPVVLDLLHAICGDVADLRTEMVGVQHRLGALELRGAILSRQLDRLNADIRRIAVELDRRQNCLSGDDGGAIVAPNTRQLF